MRSNLVVVAIGQLLLISNTATAQKDSVSVPTRERPHVEGNPHRFRSFTGNGDWHSCPSTHVAHITSIAQAISMQTQSGSVTALCGSLVALMAWDRVYEDQHWTSDVTATIALSSIISSATVRWMESRHSHSR